MEGKIIQLPYAISEKMILKTNYSLTFHLILENIFYKITMTSYSI